MTTLLVQAGALAAASTRTEAVALALAHHCSALAAAPAGISAAGAGDPLAHRLGGQLFGLHAALGELAMRTATLAGDLAGAQRGYELADRQAVEQAAATPYPIPLPRPPSELTTLAHDGRAAASLGAALGAELVTGIAPRSWAGTAAWTGRLVPAGPGWAAGTGPPVIVPAPRSTVDLLSEIVAAQQHSGEVAITRVSPDHWIVALPGIHSLLPTADPQDLPGALSAFGRTRGSYARSVIRALTLAAVPTGAKLLLVGHSEGGIVAADLAADLAADATAPPRASASGAATGHSERGSGARWQVTDVLTAASPIGGIKTPAGVRLLALDDVNDVVPSLDLTRDMNMPDRSVIRFRGEHGSIGANHGLVSSYLPFAASPALTGDSAARAWLAHAAPYLGTRQASRQVFLVRDRPPAP